ncbi:unnamed protein product [Dicrocoelium dendriticum]|nr:unnamed protein product [Dicrocoelium dendriticum]
MARAAFNSFENGSRNIRAINQMCPPTDAKAVSIVNGMVNYWSRFLPRLADVTLLFRKLTYRGEA